MKDILSGIGSNPLLAKSIAAVIILALIWIVAHYTHFVLARRIPDTGKRYRGDKLTTFFAFLAAIVALSIIFTDRLGGFIPALGILGAGIAFALQEVIASIAGWLAISFSNFYRVGDRVQLGGIRGDVIDIGVLRTTLMEIGEWVNSDLYNGRVVRVANSFIFKEPVFNYTAHFPFLWDEIRIPVTFDSDIGLARKVMLRAAETVVGEFTRQAQVHWREMERAFIIEDTPIEPQVTITANENWIEFVIRYVVYYKRRRVTKDLIFTRLLEEFAKTGGKVTMASSTFKIVGLPEMNVTLKEEKAFR